MLELAHAVGTSRDNLKLLAFMIGAAVFFVVTLFISFFIVIVALNNSDIPGEDKPNMFMLGLIPPSIGTFLLFTKVFGRFM
jgi:uncharacterized BrkB/YihY/UPF0761 family membrane protein